MTILEIHQALSRSLGDSFTLSSNPTVIPDGVRYSTAQRNNYLYRAMLYILDEVFVAVQHLERKDANKALYKLIPNMITSHPQIINFNSGTNDRISYLGLTSFNIAKILNANGTSNYTSSTIATTYVPIHFIKDPLQISNHRLNLRPDAYMYFDEVVGDYAVVDENYELMDGTWAIIVCIDYPSNPALLGMNNNFPFEERFVTKIIQLASMYAWQDSEDLENASMLAQTIKPMQPVQEVRNANSNQ